MATKAFTGRGTELLVGNANVSVMQIKSVQWTAPKWTFDDITNWNSPEVGAGVIRESVPTVLEPGEFTGQGIYLPSDTGRTALTDAFANAAITTFQVQLPIDTAGGQANVGDLYSFTGYVEDQPLPDGIMVDKAVTYKLTVKINSVITYTPGS